MTPYEQFAKDLQDDPHYARGWFDNVAVKMYDYSKGKLTLKDATEIAVPLMKYPVS